MTLWVLTHALAVGAFALVSYGAGNIVVRRLPALSRDLQVAMAIGLGSGLVAQTLFAVAAAGMLTRASVLTVLAAAAAAGLVRRRGAPAAERLDRGSAVTTGLLLAATVPSFALALYPPAAFDATMYHLPYARLFAETGGLAFADTLRFPVFPQLAEMLFAGALLVADDVTAQLTQWLALAVTTVTTAGLARELGGRHASLLAGAAWVGTPFALFLGSTAYIDCSLAMYVTLAFAAWHAWRRDGHSGWAALAGAFAGAAAATKYHGLFFVVVLLLAFAWRSRRGAGAFALLALLVAGPWYARIGAATGNPLFPFLGGVFGRSEWSTSIDRRLDAAAADPAGTVSRTVQDLPSAIRSRIRQKTSQHNLGLLLLLPAAVAAAASDRRQRFPVAASFAYLLVVSPLDDWRFMVAVMPVLSIAVATGLTRFVSNLRPPLPAAAAACFALALAGPGLVRIAGQWHEAGPIPLRSSERDAFLARRIRVYDALRFLARTRGRPVVYVLHEENAAYYCPGRCLGERLGPYRYTRITPLLDQPEQLSAKLREFGATVLVAPRRENLGAKLARSGAFRQVFRSRRSEAFEIRADR